jgi:DnaJ like chaperone protein
MKWVGKVVGGALGFMAGGPIGSLLGAVLGHQFDQGLGSATLREGLAGASDAQAMFFATTFEVMGHVAKSDGRVSEDEIRVARRIMHSMKLDHRAVRAAIERFTAGKASNYPLRRRLAELAAVSRAQRDIARAFMNIQLQAAMGAGPFTARKRELLWTVAQSLGVGRVEFAQLEAELLEVSGRSGMSLDSAYQALGIDASASDADVKKAYRRMMNKHHPDKLIARGIPESMVDVAEAKTHEVRMAYERIRESRGIR